MSSFFSSLPAFLVAPEADPDLADADAFLSSLARLNRLVGSGFFAEAPDGGLPPRLGGGLALEPLSGFFTGRVERTGAGGLLQ